jgi:hypothetical protein
MTDPWKAARDAWRAFWLDGTMTPVTFEEAFNAGWDAAMRSVDPAPANKHDDEPGYLEGDNY